MEENENFTQQLFSAFEQKVNWYNSDLLPKVLECYRNLHAHVENLFTTLLNKGTIVEDPYKHDKKISKIVAPPDTVYSENERNIVIGTRLSDYESILDFVCNYLKFSVENLNVEQIKNLASLNSVFQWNAIVPSSTKPNTRGLAECLMPIKQGSDTLTASVINDSLNNAAKTVAFINSKLKELADFQREVYKMEIRKDIICSPLFPTDSAYSSPDSFMSCIKKAFPQLPTKKPFYQELIEEIIQEEIGSDKSERQKKLFDKLLVTKETKEVKEKVVDTRAILMDSVRTLAAVSPQLDSVVSKLEENCDVIENQKMSFWEKISDLLRQAFNIDKKPLIYKIIIVEPLTQAKKSEEVNFNSFLINIQKRSKYYTSFSMKKTPGYEKIDTLSDEKVLEFLNKQLAECQKLLVMLTAFDDFFKETASPMDRIKIKGIKMEITSIKNTIVKTNQRKADYSSVIEEQVQLKKLGITDE